MFLISLVCLLLPVAAACGWYAARTATLRQLNQTKSSRVHRDYFRGLNYLINEQPDKAVDVFVKLLEVDSDTVETHLALGSLFRRSGQVDRAIRVHQNLIARPQLSKSHRLHALSELGQDYLRAGVLDRAERLFLELVEQNDDNQGSLNFLLEIYQQEKDWLSAIKTARRLALQGGVMGPTIAQYYCELADAALAELAERQARHYLRQAQVADPNCVRASLLFAQLASQNGHPKEAISHYQLAIQQDTDYVSEIIQPLCNCYLRIEAQEELLDKLYYYLDHYQHIEFAIAIATHLSQFKNNKAAIDFLAKQIQRFPALKGLNYLISLYVNNTRDDAREKLVLLQGLIDKLLAHRAHYQCNFCGFSGNTLYWLCPGCHQWGQYKPLLDLA